MHQIVHRIGIKSNESAVFTAINTVEGLARWWTEEVEGDCQIGQLVKFTFRSSTGDVKGLMQMEILQMSLNHRLTWKCVDGPADWLGTEICFELQPEGDQTIVLFSHRNWRESNDHVAHCSTKWATFLLSLRDYVENGSGKPAPHDLKIDNWN